MKKIAPGYSTKGLVTLVPASSGDSTYNYHIYDNKIKVRVPEIHGLTSSTEAYGSYTKDEDLPFATVSVPYSKEMTSVRRFIMESIFPGDVVYVTFPTGNQYDILVTGVCATADSSGIVVANSSDSVSASPAFVPTKVSNTNYNSKWGSIFYYPFSFSLGTVYMSSNYGWRVLDDGSKSNHRGVDLCYRGGTEGKPVYAAGNGEVVHAGDNGDGYGVSVVIDHGVHNGEHLLTRYGHMMKGSLMVTKGTKITNVTASTSTPLGKADNTGHSFGSHLHFEFRQGSLWGNTPDPHTYLDLPDKKDTNLPHQEGK